MPSAVIICAHHQGRYPAPCIASVLAGYRADGLDMRAARSDKALQGARRRLTKQAGGTSGLGTV